MNTMAHSLEVINNSHNNFDDPFMKGSNMHDDLTDTESSDPGCDGNIPPPTEDRDAPRMVNGEDWNHITKPGTHDVLLGRGGGTNNHSGNIKFRKLVNEHKMRYLACSKVDKPKVAREVVAIWRKLKPTGRFLARKDETKKGPGSVKSNDNVWYEVGDKKAREKASQCLRERTPDVLPYIKHLRDQQNAITEHGVSMVQMQMQQQNQEQQQPHGVPNMMHSPHHPHPHHPQHNHMHSMHAYGPGYVDPAFGGGVSPAAFPRRNSMPNQHPHSAPPGAPMPFNPGNRRGSLPAVPPMGPGYTPVPPMRGCPPPMMAPSHEYDDFGTHVADMSEMEYQQHMMMLQQNMMQQQYQMQRMQQSRMQGRMRNNMDGSMNNRAMDGSMNNRAMDGSMNNVPARDPAMGDTSARDPATRFDSMPRRPERNSVTAEAQRNQVQGSKPKDPTTSPSKNKRSRDETETEAQAKSKPSAPDRTTSLMSLTPADPNSHELSLEDYRQQLEEYIANSNKNEGDDGEESDLEDDWEKERERAIKQQSKDQKKRGVNRNVSGMSCLSLKSSGAMSMVSGFSGFSDLKSHDHDGGNDNANTANRENKMNMARSVCSNLSLMSELTDLSHNIDNLSIYDD